jgi:nucleoside-diphosphate-sugar epimerase
LRHLIITGASGLLGSQLVARAQQMHPELRITALSSPRKDGIDLTDPNCGARILAEAKIGDPGDVALIHAAAAVRNDAVGGHSINVSMTQNVAQCAVSAGLGFCILVSSVSVYVPSAVTTVQSCTAPASDYGASKLMAEKVWEEIVPAERGAIVRFAGIWGWQPTPTLFWNQILLAAGRGSPPQSVPIVRRKASLRNYISVSEASDCLLEVAAKRNTGTFLAAGRDLISTESFVCSVQGLPGSRLSVEWEDDGGCDRSLYGASPELMPCLTPFDKTLASIWQSKPGWLLE